ncbi:Isoleucine--tRNA ligase [Candidatus Tiddalikarchaeum anstoanum]|nr:Isoleucine--tRNA ligase [Candidatus Tiddalikarchaeum anstoanum]
MDIKSEEEIIAKFWEDNKIFEKSVDERPKSKQYIFYDGPPFATGTPHYGHILGLTSKDLFPRYWTMKGYRCSRVWGWDCHGLPIENIAEKELGIKEKKAIEEMGISKFNNFCRSKVLFFAGEWKKTVRRMGKWIDFDNSYKTMDNTYMETIWYIFKNFYEKDYIYEDKKILMYCPRCETPLSKAEIEMDAGNYKDVTEKTATVKFKLKDEKNTYILAWTTTPWTLIGNVALAVNPEITYVKLKRGKDYLILAKERLKNYTNDEIIEEFKGKKLVGKEYEPLYPMPVDKKAYVVVDGGNEVTAEDGTGVVHLALYGEFDFNMIKKYDLARIQHIGVNGKLAKGPKDWIGLWFKNVDPEVIKDLDKRGILFEAENHTHSYPFCYRCSTPLIYNAVNSYFVNIQKMKDKIKKDSEEINWHPSNIKEGRFNYILDTAPDWTISRNRFWATAIPVWKCGKCNKITVIGSVKELQEKAIEKVPDNVDLHKDTMDNIHLKCDCKGRMNRTPEVIDCWFESGAMPYAAKHYPFENKDYFKTNFPADFVSEYVGQVRAWFYYMHVIGVLLMDKAPFKHVVVTGNILAEDGTKMSKSKKNFPDPNLIFDKFGADALRFYLMSNPVMAAQDINFSEKNLDNVYKKVVLLVKNVSNFYKLFNEGNNELNDNTSKNILDKWIISRLNLLMKSVTNNLDNYDTVSTCSDFMGFIDDLSTWYVRRSRDRFKSDDKKERTLAVKTLGYVIYNLVKMLAPITPFVAEEVYQDLRKSDKKLSLSVHLDSWPKFDNKLIDETLNSAMTQLRSVVSKALDKRDEVKIPIRQALREVKITGCEFKDDYLELIKDELNVKKVSFIKGKEIEVELDTKLTPELVKEGYARELIRRINDYRKELKLTIKDRVVLYLETSDKEIMDAFNEYKIDVLKSVQADKGEVKLPKGIDAKEVSINGKSVKFTIKKV